MTEQSSRRRECPYVGLMPFEPEDAEYFFGREQDTEILRINAMAAPSTLIYGPSGVGKSSILNAGLLPVLMGQDDVVVGVFREWTSDPVPGIRAAVVEAASRKQLHADLQDQESLAAMLEQVADDLAVAIAEPDELLQRPGRVVLILDQFEEYIINHTILPETEAELTRAFAKPHPSVAVMVSIREDWLARLDRFRRIFPALFDNFIRVKPLSSSGAQRAISGPLERYATIHPADGPTSAEQALADSVIEQVRRTDVSNVLPIPMSAAESDSIDTAFLQIVLTRLWNDERRAGSSELRLSTLEEIGNASRILDDHLATVFDAMDPEQQMQAVEMFDRLVTPSETKVAQSAEDLGAYLNADTAALETILEMLSQPESRILRSFSPRDRPDSKRYELYHDLLAKPVRSWLVGRRVESQVRENLAKRKPAEAEIARQILLKLLEEAKPTVDLAHALARPGDTVEAICSSLAGAGILSKLDTRWVFRPGRGFRLDTLSKPFTSLLTERDCRVVTWILAGLTLIAAGLAVMAWLNHPFRALGEGTLGQLADATLVLLIGGLLGGSGATLWHWIKDVRQGLASADRRIRLPLHMVRALALSTFGIGVLYYGTAYISGNGAWLLGNGTLWMSSLVGLFSMVYADPDTFDK